MQLLKEIRTKRKKSVYIWTFRSSLRRKSINLVHTHKHKQIRLNFEKEKEQTNETSEHNDKVVSSTIT